MFLAAVLTVVAPFPAPVDAVPAQPVGSYTNPVVSGLSANPSVLKAPDGSYYAFLNGFDLGGPWLVPALRSTDLASWTALGSVLATPGAWADASSGLNFTSPSVHHLASNPAASRYVMYFTARQVSTGNRCIGVATASSPAGPFTGAATPLVCPSGGAQDPSIVSTPTLGFHQLLYKKNGTDAGIYNQMLTANGQGLASGWSPISLFRAHPSWWHNGVVERPTFATDGTNNYLFFAGGTANTASRAIGWSPCTTSLAVIQSCSQQTRLGTFISGTSGVASPSGPQVFSDGTRQWLAYDGLPGGSCSGTTCTGTRNMRIDKLCFAHGQPRTSAPSTGSQSLGRSANCSSDIPGRPLSVQSIQDNQPLSQPAKISFRDGGATVPLNGRVLWLFSDAFVRSPCPGLSNSAALGVPAAGATGPNWSTEPVDGNGCSRQVIPYTAEEIAYNTAHATTDGKRIALWEQGGIPLANGEALVFFMKLIHDRDIDGSGSDPGCDICYEHLGQGAVHIAAGATVVNRSPSVSPVACNPTCLFPVGETYARPFIDNGHVYAYGDGYYLARAPLSQVEVPSAWQAWNDAPGWGPLAQADKVPGLQEGDDPANWDGGAAQVSYNPYLDRYVNVGDNNVFARNEVVIQTAPAPEGPWTAEQLVYDSMAHACGASFGTYGTIQSPELVTDGGRSIPFAYARPGPGLGTDPSCPGQVRLVQIRLG